MDFLKVFLIQSCYSILRDSLRLPPKPQMTANMNILSMHSLIVVLLIWSLVIFSISISLVQCFCQSTISECRRFPVAYTCCISVVSIGSEPSLPLTFSF